MKKDTPNGLQRDIFTEQISVFSCPITSPDSISHHHTRTIGQVIDAGVKYADNVQHIRQARLTAMSAHRQGDVRGYDIAMEQYKQMKANAHFCIFQGICPQRNDNAMEQYSRVLCLDLDAPKPTDRKPPNTWVNDWEQVKATISQLPFVAYCGLSIGGMGLFVLIPIKEPARHKEYFNTLASVFKKHLRLDVDRGRGLSVTTPHHTSTIRPSNGIRFCNHPQAIPERRGVQPIGAIQTERHRQRH